MHAPGDVISHAEMCASERKMLQAGMHFRCGGNYSVLLMSQRRGAPYDDVQDNRTLIYEGHDWPKSSAHPYPKQFDQPLANASGSPTQNGRFFHAAKRHKDHGEVPERVRVYEKIHRGVWVYNGVFHLCDAWLEECNGRKVVKLKLELVDEVLSNSAQEDRPRDLPHARLIPTHVKLAVWKRDRGICQHPNCGATDNLHFDHILPFSKGGSSIIAENIQLLCARHNLAKHDRIE